MNKVYTRINWENYPSEKTAVNENNLNKMDSALNEIDTRVVEHETTKANVSSLNELINYWHIDETTGVITIHKVSGEQIIFDLNLEKVPVGFSMTDDGILIMTTDDGTEFTANIGSMIPVLTFNDSEQIAVSVSGEGVNKTYTFTIKTGSITEDKLQPNFLADCRLYAGNAEESANKSEEYAKQAQELVEEAEASFTELSYADYKAGNYDPTKSYAITDYPYSDGSANRISFNDTNTQLGADDVQGAIETINSNLAWSEWIQVIGYTYYRIRGDGLVQLRIDLRFDTSTAKSIVAYTNNNLGVVLPSEIVPQGLTFFTSVRWLGTSNKYYSATMYCDTTTGNLMLTSNNADTMYAATGNVLYYLS